MAGKAPATTGRSSGYRGGTAVGGRASARRKTRA